ncbi:MAG TPA: hypothetical protein VGD56_11740, partial [Gemmatirosa sp.]
ALLRVAARDRAVIPDDEIPAPVGPGRAALAAGIAYASLGGPRDSVLAAHARAIAMFAPPGGLRSAGDTSGYVRRLFVLSFPELHEALAADTNGWYLLAAQRAAVHGQTDAVRAALTGVASRRTLVGIVPTVDAAFQEAWLQAWSADTAAAIRTLEMVIGSLRNQNTHILDDVPRAAAVGRALALRARLRDQRPDDADGRRASGSAVAALWRDADAGVLRANGLVPAPAAVRP